MSATGNDSFRHETAPGVPVQGVGLGLRQDFGAELSERRPADVDWVEIHPENYVWRGGRYEASLERAQEIWPIVPHGLTLCFGSTQRHEATYTTALKHFLRKIRAPWYSDHLCFGGANDVFVHDLLPLPFTSEAVDVAAQRIREVQDAIEVPVALENISFYGVLGEPEMSEAEFLCEVIHKADCKLMLDVNNVYVNSINHGFSAEDFIAKLPLERVVQIHVAGHFTRKDGLIIDTHGEDVCEGVYALLDNTLRKTGPVPVLLERDGNFPPLDTLLGEMAELQAIYRRATTPAAKTARSLEAATAEAPW